MSASSQPSPAGPSYWEKMKEDATPPELLRLLTGKWTESHSTLEARTTTRTGHDVSTGARVETGEAIHSFISNLVQRRAPGIQALCFLGVKTCGTTQLLHSLFSLPQGPYDESTPRLCALVDDVPADGFPTIALLTPMAFASNEPFPGSSEEEFESHVTGLPSTLLRNLDTNAMQAASVADEGTRTINSRGLTFLSGANLALLLQLGFSPTISAAACALAPHLLHSDEPHADLALQWIQASFTKRDEEDIE